MPDYWLDANTFIESKNRFYGFDIVPGFWTFIETQAIAGIVASSTLVYDELARESDELAMWVRARKVIIFIEPDQEVQRHFTEIANHVNSSYSSVHAGRFLSGADPWLIAHAKTYGGTIVTQETKQISGQKAKIPNVCIHFGVESIDLFDMLRRLGARFG